MKSEISFHRKNKLDEYYKPAKHRRKKCMCLETTLKIYLELELENVLYLASNLVSLHPVYNL